MKNETNEPSLKNTYKTTAEYRIQARVKRLFAQGIKEYHLINPNDHILVGLSGGKDSMALLDLLCEWKRHMMPGTLQLTAAHITMKHVGYESDIQYLHKFTTQLGVPFETEEVEFTKDTKEGRTPCFLCSWNRRKKLFEIAQQLGCNKIALGHHQDDILATTLMNLTFTGSFSTMPVFLAMRKIPITLIRPLCKIAESDLNDWQKIRQYQQVSKRCPFEHESNRTHIRKLLQDMELLNTDYRYNIWRALEKEDKLVEK